MAINEVSLYTKQPLTERNIAINIKRLQSAFPRMRTEFFDLLAERIVGQGFSDARLTDAVNHVIDNFQYKELNVSDVIGFDKRVKYYTQPEVCDLSCEKGYKWEDFTKRMINGTYYWVLNRDLLKWSVKPTDADRLGGM